MEDIVLTPKELQHAIDHFGWTPEQQKVLIPKLSPYQKRFLRHLDDFFKYKIIMEVRDVKVCARQAKPGQKTVFGAVGMFLPEESTFPGCGFCTWAITQIQPFLYVVYDRICSGVDPSPMGIDYVRCPDIAPEDGGTGEVTFKVYCIKSQVNIGNTFRNKFKV